MAAAFAAAGYVPAQERAMKIAIQAHQKHAGTNDGNLRVSFVRKQLVGETSQWIADHYDPRGMKENIKQLLNDAAEFIAAQRPKVEVKQHTRAAPRQGDKLPAEAEQPIIVKSKPPIPPKPTFNDMVKKQTEAMRDKAAMLVKLSILDRVMIDGKAARYVTVGRVQTWIREEKFRSKLHLCDLKVFELLCENKDPNMLVGQITDDQTAEQLLRRVQGGAP